MNLMLCMFNLKGFQSRARAILAAQLNREIDPYQAGYHPKLTKREQNPRILSMINPIKREKTPDVPIMVRKPETNKSHNDKGSYFTETPKTKLKTNRESYTTDCPKCISEYSKDLRNQYNECNANTSSSAGENQYIKLAEGIYRVPEHYRANANTTPGGAHANRSNDAIPCTNDALSNECRFKQFVRESKSSNIESWGNEKYNCDNNFFTNNVKLTCDTCLTNPNLIIECLPMLEPDIVHYVH